MANSGGASDNFEYDVFADVSQHGSSVFDFFGSAGLSSHQIAPAVLSSSLENAQPPQESAMVYPFPFVGSAMNFEQAPPKEASDAEKEGEKDAQNATRRPQPGEPAEPAAEDSSAKHERKPKSPSTAERKPVKKTITKTLGPKTTRPPFPARELSLSTLSALPPMPHRSLAAFSAHSDGATASGLGKSGSSSSPNNGTTTQSPSPSAATNSAAAAPVQDVHNSHTRRCRAKVNNKFAELLSVLPTPPPKTGVKHKAQILDYTIRVFREMYAKKLDLEAELALSSRAHLNSWVESIVRPANALADVLNPLMSLLCTKEKFVYAESWVRVEPTQGARKNGVVARASVDPLHQSGAQSVG